MKRRNESIEERLSYREPLKIEEIRIMKNGDGFAICPRCRNFFDVEYQPFCSYCGQAIDWRGLDKAKKVVL